jgi:hypothetical protein
MRNDIAAFKVGIHRFPCANLLFRAVMASPSQLLWEVKHRQPLAKAQCRFANPGTGAAKRANNCCLRQGGVINQHSALLL